MKQRKRASLWFRVVPAATLGIAIAGAGCKKDDTPPPISGSFTASPSTTGGPFRLPLDAVPSSDGSTFFFLAMNQQGQMGVFKVAGSGGAATQLAAGAPLIAPTSLSVSGDDQTLYIADAAAGQDATDPDSKELPGRILTLSASGGSLQAIASSAGTRPRGVEVVSEDGVDQIYFTGNDPTTREPAVFKMSAAGALTTVAKGAPLVDPSGVAVAKSRDVYVVNTTSAQSGQAAILKISGGNISEFLGGLAVGYPAGLALTMDDGALLLSARDENANRVLVQQIGVADKAVQGFNQGISENIDPGGLHRARGSNVFAWAGVTAGGGGTVYRVEFK